MATNPDPIGARERESRSTPAQQTRCVTHNGQQGTDRTSRLREAPRRAGPVPGTTKDQTRTGHRAVRSQRLAQSFVAMMEGELPAVLLPLAARNSSLLPSSTTH